MKLGKPFRTPDGPKKFSVYVKNEKGNVVKVNFGDPNMEIKKDNPKRRKELADRLIQATQDEASLASQEQQLAEVESLLVKVDDYELLSLKTEIAKQNLQEAMLWRDRMSRQIRLLQPPMVSILGGE